MVLDPAHGPWVYPWYCTCFVHYIEVLEEKERGRYDCSRAAVRGVGRGDDGGGGT